MPPAAPMARFQFVLEVAPSAAADVLATQQMSVLPKGWPTTEAEITSLLERFQPLRLEFDFGGVQADYASHMVTLTPGYSYELNAEILVCPIYSKERVWSLFSPIYTIDGWDRSARTFVRKFRLAEPSQQYQIEIRHKVTFSTTSTVVGWVLDLRGLILAIGGACGYIVMGHALLYRMRVFVNNFRTTKEGKRHKEAKAD